MITSSTLRGFMSKKKPYFPNNWEAYNEADSSLFEEVDFEDFLSWKVTGWELPSSVSCIIRTRNVRSGKIKELVYKQRHAAQSKVKQLVQGGEHEFTICDSDQVYFHYVDPINDYKIP